MRSTFYQAVLASLFFICVGESSATEPAPEFILSWPICCSPHDAAVDANGGIWVTPASGRTVRKYDSVGNQLQEFDPADYCWGIEIAPDGTLLLVSTTGHTVYRYDSDGQLLMTLGGYGTGDGQFNRPERVACDADGNLYVTENTNDRVQKFDSQGNFLAKRSWGGRGDPIGIDVASNGDVYVAVSDTEEIWRLTSDLNFVMKWSTPAGSRIYDLRIDADDNIHVTDLEDKIRKYDSSGTLLVEWGESGAAPGQLDGPRGIALEDRGCLWIVESGNGGRISRFCPATVGIESASWSTLKELFR